MVDLPESYEKVAWQNWFHIAKQALKAKLIFSSLRQFYDYFNTHELEYEILDSKLEELGLEPVRSQEHHLAA